MKRLREGREEFRHLGNKASTEKTGLLRPGIFSLLLHIALAIFLVFNLKSAIPKGGSSVYRVTLRSFMPSGDGLPQGGSSRGPQGVPAAPPVDEKPKSGLGLKRTETGERPKPDLKKTEKKVEKPEKGKVPPPVQKEKGFGKPLQEALEDIRRKAALENIQKRVARRETTERPAKEGGSFSGSSQGPIVSSSGSSAVGSGTGSGSGTGTGSGTGSGPGSAAGSPGGSPGGGLALETRLNDYYNLIWAKIKKEWTLPEDLPKGKIDFEAVIVVIIEKDGKIQKSWFEKKSGNSLYDQMAMRAIKKAEPFPPIPKEFSDDTFELGIRFHPD